MTGRRLVVEADGGSRGNPGPAGYGAVVRDADTGEVLREVAAGIGRVTNNVAEYRGLLAGLRAAAELQPAAVEVRMDSKLVVEQMAGRWQVKHPDMRALRAEAAEVVRRLPTVRFTHVPRAQNSHADRLANEAMDAAARGQTWVPPVPGASVGTGGADAAVGAVPASGAGSTPTADGAGSTPTAVSAQPGWGAPSGTPTRLLLLRHGQTPLSVDRRFSGTGPAELTDLGREQAAAAARRLGAYGPIDAVLSSPLPRAASTAAAVAAELGLALQPDDGWRETDFGSWEAATFAAVRDRDPAQLTAWLEDPEVAPPGGESFAATAVRVRQARDRVLAAYPGRTVVVVSHVTPIKTLVRLALDAPPSAMYRMHLDLACLSIVDWYADGPAVLRLLNDTSHLASAAGADPLRA